MMTYVWRLWVGVAALFFLTAIRGRAQEERATATILDTEPTAIRKDIIIVRGAFEITGPQRWYEISFQLQFDGNTFLTRSNGRAFLQVWSTIFTPENVSTARYSDVRAGLKIAEIESAQNLPRATTTRLWVTCNVFDQGARKYIAHGWDRRTPLFITTDESGKIVNIRTFYTRPFQRKKNHHSAKIPAKECVLSLAHLKLKPRVGAYRTYGLRNDARDILYRSEDQGPLKGSFRGRYFEPIDTPEKARELVELEFPDSALISSASQYQAIVTELRKVRGWDEKKYLLVPRPAFYGLSTEEVPGYGYRVRALLAYHHEYGNLRYRSVVAQEFNVSVDGRIHNRETVCILAPKTPYGAPPGWKPEFGWDPKSGGIVPQEAAIDAYNAALEAGLKTEEVVRIPNRLTVTNRKNRIHVAHDENPDWFRKNLDD